MKKKVRAGLVKKTSLRPSPYAAQPQQKSAKGNCDLTQKHVNDRHPDRENWPGASEPHQGEDEKVRRVAMHFFGAMKFSAQSPESVPPERNALFFATGV